jgi:hypothetical protein
MHICLSWSSVLNISNICVRVTWIRWVRNMLCRFDFHQVLDFDHHFISIISTISVECHFRMNLMTCKKIFPSVWKNPKTVFWSKTSKTWWKWWIEIENLIKMKSARLFFFDKSLSYDHRWMSFSYESDDMQEKFFICMKKSENDFSSDDLNNWFSSSSRSFNLSF